MFFELYKESYSFKVSVNCYLQTYQYSECLTDILCKEFRLFSSTVHIYSFDDKYLFSARLPFFWLLKHGIAKVLTLIVNKHFTTKLIFWFMIINSTIFHFKPSKQINKNFKKTKHNQRTSGSHYVVRMLGYTENEKLKFSTRYIKSFVCLAISQL